MVRQPRRNPPHLGGVLCLGSQGSEVGRLEALLSRRGVVLEGGSSWKGMTWCVVVLNSILSVLCQVDYLPVR
jgi:hypothetical protein